MLTERAGKVIMVDPLQRGDSLDLMTEIVLRKDEMATAYAAEFGGARADGVHAGDASSK